MFGIFSFEKNGGKETLTMSRTTNRKIVEGVVLDNQTRNAIETTWDNLNPLWKTDFNKYTKRYNQIVLDNPVKFVSAKKLYIDIIKRTIDTKKLSQPLYLTIDDFGSVLKFPEGVDYTVYWFVMSGNFPLLEFRPQDFQYTTVP